MALRNILNAEERLLRQKSREVVDYNQNLHILLDDMRETMLNANGAGLAAPQVGILKRAIIVSVDGGETMYELVNPVITKQSGKQCGIEGCLSLPGRSGYVERPKKLVVEGFDRNGNPIKIKAEGYLAVAFCHEVDHLDGILYTDKLVKEA